MRSKEGFLYTTGSSLSLTGQGGLEQWRKVWEDLGPSASESRAKGQCWV